MTEVPVPEAPIIDKGMSNTNTVMRIQRWYLYRPTTNADLLRFLAPAMRFHTAMNRRMFRTFDACAHYPLFVTVKPLWQAA